MESTTQPSPTPSEPKKKSFSIRNVVLGVLAVIAAFIAVAFYDYSTARSRNAERVGCVGAQMKGIVHAAKDYAADNGGKFPPDFLSLSNEVVDIYGTHLTPQMLVCRSDKTKTPAPTWSDFKPEKNCSYEFLAPNKEDENSGTQAVIRCPIHKHIVMSDYSYQRESHAEQ